MCRLGIELRDHPLGVLTLLREGEGNTAFSVMRATKPAPRSQRPGACTDVYRTEPGRPCAVPASQAGRAGEMKKYVQHRHRESDRTIVVKKRANKIDGGNK
jgi:hypothetical protein